MGILYYDCFAGISGDMNLGAMIDLGVDPQLLINELGKLALSGYSLKVGKDQRRGITGTRVEVLVDEAFTVQRTYADIVQLIEQSAVSTFVKQKSLAMFRKLAEAEGKVHNIAVNEVHFHEVGAVDSIVDIVGAAVCFELLKPSKIICGPVQLGSGMVTCAHGLFPVPAPATADILTGIPVKTGLVPFEATTPTGAIVIACNVDAFVHTTEYTVEKTAYGIGFKDSVVPNVLRVQWCTDTSLGFNTEQATVLECNIDDMNPELFDAVFDDLFSKGADDVFIDTIVMKKSRPAFKLSVICKQNIEKELIHSLLRNTSSLGVRAYAITKHMLEREIFEFKSSLGVVRVKKSWHDQTILKYKPEYDDCASIAVQLKMPLMQVMLTIQTELNSHQ